MFIVQSDILIGHKKVDSYFASYISYILICIDAAFKGWTEGLKASGILYISELTQGVDLFKATLQIIN
jgi:hypothetical protein